MLSLNRFKFSLAALLLFSGLTPASAEIVIQHLDPSTPAKATARVTKVQASPAVVIPFFRVDLNNPLGETTLYAIRNNSSNALTVKITIFGPDGTVTTSSNVNIAARGVYPADVRSVQGLPSTNGIATGSLVAEALGADLPSNALSGDYFRVDASGAAANGGAMLPLADTACTQWSHRVLDGGGFDGGTTISVLAIGTPADSTLSGNVYNEAGQLVAVVGIRSDEVAFEVSGADLNLPIDFGSIDWVFAGDGHGAVSVTYSALGLFSVGSEAACVDISPETDPDVEPPVPGTVTFELPGTFLDCDGCGNWQYDMFFDGTQEFSKVILDFDLYVEGWDPNRPTGFHCIFWLNNSTRWQEMMGYLNARGTQNRTVFQSNGPLGNPIGVEKYRNASVSPGQNFKVHYEYDTINRSVSYEVHEAAGPIRVFDSIPLPDGVGKLRTSYAFMQFGSQPNGAVESLTEGWRWSNMRIQFIP